MMNAEEQEYMDYLIHNRMELTNQITGWLVFREKPTRGVYEWIGGNMISDSFNIEPFDGDWQDSLIKCGEPAIIKKHKEEV